MTEIVVAFDVSSGREALGLAGRLRGLKWAKIGPVLFVRDGPALVREFTARGVRVFLDLKWHDIPSTVAGAVLGARELGVSLATVHCLGGEAMLAAACAAAGDLDLVGVTVLTSHDAAAFEGVVGRGVPDLGVEAQRLARMALRATASLSMKVAWAAPRDSASSPSAPLPAKASSTRAPCSGDVPSAANDPCSRMLNSASRVRSAVGRTSSPAGASMRRPLCLPPTMRIGAASTPHPTLPLKGGGNDSLIQRCRRK